MANEAPSQGGKPAEPAPEPVTIPDHRVLALRYHKTVKKTARRRISRSKRVGVRIEQIQIWKTERATNPPPPPPPPPPRPQSKKRVRQHDFENEDVLLSAPPGADDEVEGPSHGVRDETMLRAAQATFRDMLKQAAAESHPDVPLGELTMDQVAGTEAAALMEEYQMGMTLCRMLADDDSGLPKSREPDRKRRRLMEAVDDISIVSK